MIPAADTTGHTMKFAEKYEIIEMVTSGRVSTFLARERATQEAVVVYTFECAGTGARELSTASIIARFCSLAPNPPGMIVKAGFDEPSSSAFITTKMPAPAALTAWVQAYQVFAPPPPAQPAAAEPVAPPASEPASDATIELSAFEVNSVLAKSGLKSAPPPTPASSPTADPGGGTAAFSFGEPAAASSQSAGEFTRLFREVNAFEPLRPSPAPPPTKASEATDASFGQRLGGSALGIDKPAPPLPTPPPAATEPAPGSFTREFLGISAIQNQSTPSQDVVSAPPPQKSEPGAFTREFMAISPPSSTEKPVKGPSEFAPRQSVPPPPASVDSMFGNPPPQSGTARADSPEAGSSTSSFRIEADNQKNAAGEFTRFFRDPFERPGPPEKSIPMPDPANAAPQQKPVGDFTRVFGRGDLEQAAAPLPPADSEPQSAPGTFTQIFGEISAGMGKGSQLGTSTLDTNPNAHPSFMDPPPVQPPPTVPPDPFRGGMSSTPVAPPIDPFMPRTPVAPPIVPPAANSPFMNRPGSSEATNVFRVPGADAPPVETAPSGPSEFTMFLSRGQLNAMLPPEPTGAAGAAPPPTFAPPVPQPPPFQFAPPPPPTPPAMKLPSAPAPPVPRPPVPGAAAKPGSFWPLITVLVALLAIAGMLVMYFALKH